MSQLKSRIKLTAAELRAYTEYRDNLLALNALFDLHPNQKRLAKMIFDRPENGGGVKTLYVQCGRRFGKSEAGIYIGVRKAVLFPGSEVYIIAPKRNQANEIYWASGRLKSKIPAHMIEREEDFNKTELRASLKNGSFIKVDGSDNFNALRGISPDLVINDEYRDFDEGYLGAVEPSLISKNAPQIFLTTPADTPNHTVAYRDWVKKQSITNRQIRYMQLPTSANPKIPKEWLEQKEKELKDRGEFDVWKREFLAEDCYSGAKLVFPMFSVTEHVKDEMWMRRAIERDKNKLYWIASCDPGTSTCFAVLFLAYNPYTGQVFVFDEIHETSRERTSTNQIYPEMCRKMKDLYDGEWTIIHDDAAAWFGQELLSQYSVGAFPAGKGVDKKMSRISLWKDMLLERGMVNISEKCEHYIDEHHKYHTGTNGKIVKENDHLLDCGFYGLAFLNCSTVPSKGYDEPEDEDNTWATDQLQSDEPEEKDPIWMD